MMRSRTRPEASRPAPKRLATSIDIDIDSATIRVVDPRVFRDGRRDWCRALAEIAAARPGVCSAGIDLSDGSCAIGFAAGTTAAAMADAFAASMKAAGAGTEDRPAHGPGWPFRRASHPWTLVVALADQPERPPATWAARMKDPEVLLIDLPKPVGRGTTAELARDGDRPLQALATFARTGGHARRASGPTPARAGGSPDAPPTMIVHGPTRLLYLALGWASFGMTFVGLIIPGVPTVPFLMLTGYYFARSSTRLHDWLLQTRVFGRVIREWETGGGLSWTSKANLVLLTLTAVAASVVVAGASLMVLPIIAVFSVAGIFGILRLPGLDHEPEAEPYEASGLALPAPAV
ncbi:Inner membrane protein YbaN [Aquisphaera giovannonii]|uniref:Inner membrane protein YbaN n=1 Tax=Aquisphaera giovannonii TaxID=406548 RepID=A0A5B9W445_9BACT|nr:YbaN family protein [Aquisphaera giovannonii]QEH34740.1 Inner membrane protein YbaN [Aquisphaera giovannonii]